MEILMTVIAVGVAASCLFFVGKSGTSEFLEKRKPVKQKIAGQPHSTVEHD